MTSPKINYRSLADENPFRDFNETALDADEDEMPPNRITLETHSLEHEESPHNSGIMLHIVPETSKARWNHIKDLDSFFINLYYYHQKHGFPVILLSEIFKVVEGVFVIWILIGSIHCLRHDILFGEAPSEKIFQTTLSEVIKPLGECVADFGPLTYVILIFAAIFIMVQLFKMSIRITQYAEIKKFFNTALLFEDNELDNLTWHDIQQRVRKVQAEQQMCIDKEQLTELDIYHRILRFKNYMVALVNKQLLPARYSLPIFGECLSLSRGLLLNVEWILFRLPSSPFQNNWQLRDEFTVRSNQQELSQRLSKVILFVAIVNLLLAPFIFLWQIIYFSFSYFNELKKEPGVLGLRTWSNYGRLHLRHFNELDHELDARLNRAYEYADRYLSSFSSPLMATIAKFVLFISGGVLFTICMLSIYSEHVIQVTNVISIIAVCTAIGLVCKNLIPNENMIWCPEQLMTAVLAHVHYLPPEWKQKAHTAQVRKEFGYFFQYKGSYIMNEIFSPFVTPFVLYFVFRPKSLELVKFFRSFTVSVPGVGNVCSFAQMDVRKHGNTDYQVHINSLITDELNKPRESMAGGKTEMSLVRFTLNNPEWEMPKEAASYIKGIREHAIHDLVKAKTAEYAIDQDNPLTYSLKSFGTIGEEYGIMADSVFAAQLSPEQIDISQSMHGVVDDGNNGGGDYHRDATQVSDTNFRQMLQHNLSDPFNSSILRSRHMGRAVDGMRKLRISRTEGRLEGAKESLLYSLSGIDPKLVKNPVGVTVADMCLSALYLHELSEQNRRHREGDEPGPSSGRHHQPPPYPPSDSAYNGSGATAHNTIVTSKAAENTPLLGNVHS